MYCVNASGSIKYFKQKKEIKFPQKKEKEIAPLKLLFFYLCKFCVSRNRNYPGIYIFY